MVYFIFFFVWPRSNQIARLDCHRCWSISIIHVKWLFPLVITLSLYKKYVLFFISNFCHVLNVVCFLLCNSPASEFYMPTFWNSLSVPSSYPCMKMEQKPSCLYFTESKCVSFNCCKSPTFTRTAKRVMGSCTTHPSHVTGLCTFIIS